jgi:YaiO family outer membrane protein
MSSPTAVFSFKDLQYMTTATEESRQNTLGSRQDAYEPGIYIEKLTAATSYDNAYVERKPVKPNTRSNFAFLEEPVIGLVATKRRLDNNFSRQLEPKATARNNISKTLRGLISVGFSGRSVFPKSRAGFSLFSRLPQNFELEAGLRYLNFGNSTQIYTGYLGKYYHNFMLGVRTFVTPGRSNSSPKYCLTSRYYLRDEGDYISLSIGSGISHDERSLNIQFINKNRIGSRLASAGFNHCFLKKNFVSFNAAWLNRHNNSSFISHQIDASVGIKRRF